MKKVNELLLFCLCLHLDGGISRYFNSILTYKHKSKYDITSVYYNRIIKHKYRFLAFLKAWFKLLVNRDNKLILSSRFYPEGVIAYLAFRKQAVCVHGTEIPARGIRNILFNKVLKSADKVIANSLYTKKVAESTLTAEVEINIVYPITTFGITENKQKENSKNHEDRSTLNLLTVSRLTPHKNHSLILSVLQKLIKNDYSFKYNIVGKGVNRKDLEKQVNDLDLSENVKISGFVSDKELREMYKQADIFVMPSKRINNSYEGFGLTFVEAKAFGVPSIGSIEGGMSEAIKDNCDGFLIDPESEIELYENYNLYMRIGII